MRIAGILTALALLTGATAAAAPGDLPPGGASVGDVISALAVAGYVAPPARQDSDDFATLDITVGKTPVQVYLYACSGHGDGKRCGELQLHAGFAYRAIPALSIINQWNADKRFGRAYNDAKGSHLETDMDVSSGFTQVQLAKMLQRFGTLITEFRRRTGFEVI